MMAGSRSEHALRPVVSRGGDVISGSSGWRLAIPAGAAGEYRVAQLCDYGGLRRADYPWDTHLRVSLSARISPTVQSGTWGFGLWNNPFGVTLNLSSTRLLLPAAPQAAWFFWASPASYLSLRDDQPANGMLAQTFRSDAGWHWLPPIALTLAVNRIKAREGLRRRILQDGTCIDSDPRSWHGYEIAWGTRSVEFRVDGRIVMQTGVVPRAPLGLVIWIDNQFAAFEPRGRLAWGSEATSSDAQLEIRDLKLAS